MQTFVLIQNDIEVEEIPNFYFEEFCNFFDFSTEKDQIKTINYYLYFICIDQTISGSIVTELTLNNGKKIQKIKEYSSYTSSDRAFVSIPVEVVREIGEKYEKNVLHTIYALPSEKENELVDADSKRAKYESDEMFKFILKHSKINLTGEGIFW